MNIVDVEIGDIMKILGKGEPGTGKSIFAASFPDVFIFDLDQRIRSVANFYRGIKTDIEFETFTSFDAVDQRLRAFHNRCPFKMVVFSSLTSLARMLMKQMIAMKGDKKGKLVGGIPVNTVEDYNGETGGIVKVLDLLLTLPCHIFLEAHVVEGSSYNPDGGKPKETRRLLTGGKSIASEIPVFFDEIYQFQAIPGLSTTDPTRYVCYTVPVGNDKVKTALKLPAEIDFTGRSAYELIKGYIADMKAQSEIGEENRNLEKKEVVNNGVELIL